MPEAFLFLPKREQKQILDSFSAESGMSPKVLEKDVWVCWTLNTLFTMPGAFPMAFKGGTSLSKVFNAINRFSEDVDVTIDYASLDHSVDPFDSATSTKKRDALTENLRSLVKDHVASAVANQLRDQLGAEFKLGGEHVTLDPDDAESVWVRYPSALEDVHPYLPDSVKLEFGGRNVITPSAPHTISSYLAAASADLTFPSATVTVLAAERTFWEKATLIHSELGRPEFRGGLTRLSRHWYDLDQLASSTIGETALADRGLLVDVVRVKKVFYRSGFAGYDLCATGGMRLVPTDDAIVGHLGADYSAMIDAGYFDGPPPDFEQILARLSVLQSRINTSTS